MVDEFTQEMLDVEEKSRVVTTKVHLRNFGATSAVVITDQTIQRKEDFIKAWSPFDGFDYVFSIRYSLKTLI